MDSNLEKEGRSGTHHKVHSVNQPKDRQCCPLVFLYFFFLSIMFSLSSYITLHILQKNPDIFVHITGTIFQRFIAQTQLRPLRKAASSPWALALATRVFLFLTFLTGRKHDTWKLSELDSESSLSSSGMKLETLIPRISESGELQIPYHLH